MADPASITSLTCVVVDYATRISEALYALVGQIKDGTNKSLQIGRSRDLKLHFDIALQNLSKWQELWNVVDKPNSNLQLTLWGLSGYKNARELLYAIQQDCKEIDICISQLANTRSPKQQQKKVTPKHSTFWPFTPQAKNLSSVSLEAENATWVHRKVDGLSSHVEELRSFTESSFRTQNRHSMNPSNGNCTNDRFPTEYAVLRRHFRAVEEFCDKQNLEFDLELDMLSLPSRITPADGVTRNRPRGLVVRLHNVSRNLTRVSEGFQLRQVDLGEGKARNSNSFWPSDTQSFLDFGEAPCASEPLLVHLGLEGASRYDFEFRPIAVSTSNDLRRPEQRKSSAEDTRTESVHYIPFVERLRVAFKIAECGMVLLGSRWLSRFTPDNVRAVAVNTTQRRYLARIHSLAVLKGHEQGQQIRLYGHQIYQIGLLLVMLGLNQPVDPAGIEPLKFESTVIPLVERVMGNAYSRACKFCLTWRETASQTQLRDGSDVEGATETTLKAFYVEVLLQLKGLHEKSAISNRLVCSQ